MTPARVIVVNDDRAQLRTVSLHLASAGHEVLPYTDTSAVIRAISRGADVDAFVIDLHMPGIDGWKMCRLLRSPRFPDFNRVPIIMVSATFSGDDDDIAAVTASLGADALLGAPFTRDDLLRTLDEVRGTVSPALSHVLIVDDDAGAGGSLADIFSANGMTTQQADSIAAASKAWSESPPDIAVMNFHLPDGTSEQLVREYCRPNDRTVVIMMTGEDDPPLPLRLLGMGVDSFARKPVYPGIITELAARAQRERALLRVEALLETRTDELRRERERYEALFRAIPDPVLTLSSDDVVTGCNDEASRFWGTSCRNLVGRPFTEIVPSASAGAINEALEGVRLRGRGQFDIILDLPGGEVRAEIVARTDDAAVGGGVILLFRDITERIEAEDERLRLNEQSYHSQRLESLGVLAGGVAHDFNNLLTGVLGNAGLALEHVEPDTPIHAHLTRIETAALRAADLTSQILTFSGRNEPDLQPQCLSHLVSEMAVLLKPATSARAVLDLRPDPSLPSIQGDRNLLGQVVMNLIMNASDALGDEGGRIEVRLDERTLNRREARSFYLGEVADEGRWVFLTVRDDGCGMDEHVRRQMFDPFFTTKGESHGLGLAATLGIIRTHGGIIAVDSTPGRGTTIRVGFPSSGVSSRSTASTRVGKRLPTRGGRVLIVDDDPAISELAAASLSRDGFAPLTAATGAEAIREVGSVDGIELVVLDLTMPDMTGLEVLKEIRTMSSTLPVLLSSGYSPDAVPSQTLAEPSTDFLAKPYTLAELREAVTDLLDEASESRIRAGV